MARATAASGVKSPPASEITARDEVTLAGTPEFERAVEQLVTEDDTPVDNMFSETQQRLLTGTLKESWDGPGDGRPFGSPPMSASSARPSIRPSCLMCSSVWM